MAMTCGAVRLLVAAALLWTGAGAAAFAEGTAAGPTTAPAGVVTDINMVVALDRSESVDLKARAAQVESLTAALADPRFLAAVRAGWHGRIGLSVITWSSFERTHVVLPWTLIDGAAVIADAVATIDEYQVRGADAGHKPQTDIALALSAGTRMMDSAPFQATKRILNVIADGVDNFGREAFIDRDLALAHGITINGLVHARGAAIPIVERFFETQVIGGPYAFVLTTPTPESFTTAMLRKMLLEIAAAGRSNRADGSGSLRIGNDLRVRG
jgi:hypothetical protein